MEVKGKIKVIGAEELIGSKGFRKRLLVITTIEQYPQDLGVEFVQDKCDLLNEFSVDDSVEVSINLRGREWIDPKGVSKYFNSINGWKIKNIETNDINVNEPEPVNSNDEDFPF